MPKNAVMIGSSVGFETQPLRQLYKEKVYYLDVLNVLHKQLVIDFSRERKLYNLNK